MRQDSTRKPDHADPRLHQVVMEDLRRTRWDGYARELRTLYEFYLDDERRADLARMGRIRRAASVLFWILKSLLMKLSASRRVMLVIALVLGMLGWKSFSFAGVGMDFDFRPWGFVLLLLILMLELRDKLLARDEIAVARQVQLALLPGAHPVVPGWSVWSVSRPANDVGGDLVDYIPLDGFRQGVLLGDVAGKGLGAALLSAKLQATLRALVPDAASLDDLGRRANDIFHRDGLDNRYATLFFAELEHDSGHVRFLNAGHNPAFAVRASGIEQLAASSFPLGMLGETEYEEGALDLASGDILLAYSDGLTEARNERGEEFGAERLEALLPALRGLPPAEIGERVLDEVDRFLEGTGLTDDLSLAIVVKR
jgi:sigma-B regulation protein RsbU (phosphoserine phosphatase)